MTIELDQNVANRLNEGMTTGGGIELPFYAPVLWVVNGEAKLSKVGGAQFYGGWAAKEEEITACVDYGLVVPSNLTFGDMTANDGTTFNVFTTRNVIVAPIATRKAWLKDQVRHSSYVEGGRQHVQALCWMCNWETDGENKQRVSWGPVVLSAKGYQANNLVGAFKAWDKHTSAMRRKVAPGVPAWCFYLAIGTFGKERKAEQVGKSAKSPITPIGAYLPENLNEETLTALFVGQDVAAQMADALTDAKEWLSAWAEPSHDQFGAANGDGVPEEPPFDPNDVDAIPF